MGFLQDVEAEFSAKLGEGLDAVSLTRWVGEKVLQSYRNGITAGKNGAEVIRHGRSRRREDVNPPPRR